MPWDKVMARQGKQKAGMEGGWAALFRMVYRLEGQGSVLRWRQLGCLGDTAHPQT